MSTSKCVFSSYINPIATSIVYPVCDLLLKWYDFLFHFLGGSDGSSYLDTVERYNAQENTWTHMTSMINIRSSHAAAAMDNYIFVVGGNDGSSSLKSVEKYDPKENTWTRMPPMSTRRSNLGGVVAWVLTKKR